MNNQTIHDLDEAVRELNETIVSAIEVLTGTHDVRELPLTIRDLDEAIQGLNQLIRDNPDDPTHYINRGNAYFYIRDYKRAISDYSKFIQIYPDNAKAYLSRGDAHFCKGEYGKAISDYSKSIKIDPVYAEVYYARSQAYKHIGESNQAREDEDKALKLGFDPQCDYEDEWFELFEDLVQLCPKNAKVYYYRGLVHGCTGDYNLAIADFNKALELNPRLAHAYRERAATYSLYVSFVFCHPCGIDDLDKIISDYDKAKWIGGCSYRSDPTISLFLERGEIYAEKEDYDSAIADMSEVIRRDDIFNDDYDEFILRIHEDVYLGGDSFSSDRTSGRFGSHLSARAYNNRGFYYHQKGEEDLAITDLKKALKLYNEQVELDPHSNPDFATIYLNLGSVYYAKQDYDMAVENYDNIVRLCPNYETDFIESKFVHGGQDAVEVAITLLNSRVNTPPQNADDFYYTGVQALFSNDRLSAECAFKIALLLGHGDRNKIEQHLTNLKNRE